MQPENQERCRSGRTGQSRKLLNSLWVPGVRIPLFPQKMKKKSCRVHSNSFFSSSSAKPAAGGRGCATEGSKSPQRGGWPTKSAWFYPHPNLPLGEGLVASLREGSGPVFRQSFLNLPAALPFSFRNGSIFRIFLPLRNFFSAVSLQQALWTPLSLGPLSTTAPIPAILCRCGTSFPPYPCYGFPGRHCLPSPLPQRHQFLHFPAVVERTDVLTFGR